MIQLTLRTDAIEGFCAAVSYFIDTSTIFKEVNMCFLFEKAPANQAIHIFAATTGINPSNSTASFLVDSPFIDIVSRQDPTRRTDNSSILLSVYSSALVPLKTLLEHNGEYPLVIEFDTINGVNYAIFLRYLSLMKFKQTFDNMYVSSQIHLSLINITYGITPLQYLVAIASVLQSNYPIRLHAQRNGGQNPLVNALTIRLLMNSCCSLAYGLPAFYPRLYLPVFAVDASDATSFLRLLRKSHNNSNNHQLSLSTSICRAPETEFEQLQTSIREKVPETMDLLHCPHTSHTQQSAGLVWGTLDTSLLTLMSCPKLLIQLGGSTTKIMLNAIVNQTKPTLQASVDMDQIASCIAAVQDPEECYCASDLSAYFQSSLRYASVCIYLQGETALQSLLNLQTQYPSISYEVVLSASSQEALTRELKGASSIFASSLPGVELHVMRRLGPQTYVVVTTSDLINQFLFSFSGVFCPSSPPIQKDKPLIHHKQGYDNYAIPSMSVHYASSGTSGQHLRPHITLQPINYVQPQSPGRVGEVQLSKSTPQTREAPSINTFGVGTPSTPKDGSPSLENSPVKALGKTPTCLSADSPSSKHIDLGASGSIIITGLNSTAQVSPGQATDAVSSIAPFKSAVSTREKSPPLAIEQVPSIGSTCLPTHQLEQNLLSYILGEDSDSGINGDIETILDALL
ncbi:Hypothetical protein GSB_152137 [Giardia duodenalis]|uniref:Uncharacterized protein n=2 Tax=Giardia intestinalis TaxID=5741 RepID=C6LRP3_GIAIB|nr:Hypothetical protein GL50581_1426 [Giardia intestinalis ATCC 50581]ESU41599.1 Hypothetical protein GSB_152137 [Giardia intestinalis]